MQRQPRLFRLVLLTRMVAEGVEWSDGAAALRWQGRWPNTSTWDSIDSLQTAHSRTQLHWLANTPPAAQPATPPTQAGQPETVWLPAPTVDGLCSRCGQPWPCLSCGP